MGQEAADGKAGVVLSAADVAKAKPEAGTGCSGPPSGRKTGFVYKAYSVKPRHRLAEEKRPPFLFIRRRWSAGSMPTPASFIPATSAPVWTGTYGGSAPEHFIFGSGCSHGSGTITFTVTSI